MSDIVPIASLDGEEIDGGLPTFPSVISVELFERQYPLMHGSTVYVQPVEEFSGVIVALGHPEMQAGIFMGVSADMARNIAAWLLRSADDIDAGRGKQ